ncbi:MAG TPA: carnitine dehydratase [Dehalococcoidia bacterium]|jgi:crotonobetainyl-CoA:carnitine CoA-transferase CaiB-like acyl-CoA transferase|nr:CoA transferase [SAR202 cluster bacterium]HAC19246.1 carnitine dehydratase [Dehalococcoidia bacterium]HBJ30473.1 carnitine dehydratase [Dehalococcoidia bacterium]HHZ61192.1 CoA transferase [Dehalococcoidia bacterium]HIM89255.1 CoA transferase [Dehalococcoidia bacterium]|tara:strand:+ start:623 stop:2035 length:1413 start_codon:yes stop_codon:yes gene_type:complete
MTNDALRTLLPIAGWAEDRASEVEITGDSDPILPTPFLIGETSAAALSAVGLAVSDLWDLRTGRRQEIAVDTRQATASLRSGHYMQMDGAPVSSDRNPMMGVYPAMNGRWSYLHCNFPNHRAAALSVLGVEEDREAMARAVAKWDALELEEAIIAANGAGGMVRTMDEWAQHPQGVAVASLPLLEIVKIGDSPSEKLPDGDRPLSGIRVLDLTRVLAGPTCARTLAEHGADVLKVTGAHLPSIGHQEYDTGHGKLSTHLDLREPDDLEIMRGLVREADVFSQGYRPGTLAKRGLSPEALAEIRPGIVYVSLSAFSHVGPWASRRGFDTVVQTVSGITNRQGELFIGDSPGPQFYPVSAIDYLTGYLMAFGALVALARRTTEGGSWLVRVSLAQIGRWLVERGQTPETKLHDIPEQFTPEELKRWSMTSDTPMGKLGHLGPVVRLSETPPHWSRTSVPLGYNEPVWPDRAK